MKSAMELLFWNCSGDPSSGRTWLEPEEGKALKVMVAFGGGREVWREENEEKGGGVLGNSIRRCLEERKKGLVLVGVEVEGESEVEFEGSEGEGEIMEIEVSTMLCFFLLSTEREREREKRTGVFG